MSPENKPSLALGTAQFGMPYGITNARGQVGTDEAAAILTAARHDFADMVLDTAPGYGNSEDALGHLMAAQSFRLVTKTQINNPDIQKSFQSSQQKLGQKNLYALLDHNATHLLGSQGQKALKSMEDIKAQGFVKKIGVSIYSCEEWERISTLGHVDIIQIPMNALDQRFLQSGALQRMKDEGIEIHVRSAFLQGLLLAEPGNIPTRLSAYMPYFTRFSQFCRQHDMSPIQGTLAFLNQQKAVDQIIVGVLSVSQWQDIVAAHNYDAPALDWNELSCDDPALLNPALWPRAS